MQTQRFTMIKGVSERRRLPRLGKIRLGVKVLAKTGQTYPAEVDYFVVPPEVEKVYGPKPKALDVMFPVQDRGVIFPQAYKWYGSGRGLKCIGDLERALRLNEQTGAIEPMDCPCPLLEQGQCQKRAHLMVVLPKVNMGGVYQIDTSSYNSIVDINSALEYIEGWIGRIAMVPLVLKRVPRETFGGGQRRVHYPLMLSLETNDVTYVNRLRTETQVILERTAAMVLPAPAEENPAFDEGAVVVPEEAWQQSQAESATAAGDAVSVGAADVSPSPGAPPVPSGAAAKSESAAGARPVQAAPGRTPPRAAPSGPAPARTGAGASREAGRPSSPSIGPATPTPATAKQRDLIRRLAEERGNWPQIQARLDQLSKGQASRLIEQLLAQPPVSAASPANEEPLVEAAYDESYL
jgi:hypothetical protein